MSDETKFEIGNKAELLYYSVFDLTTNRQQAENNSSKTQKTNAAKTLAKHKEEKHKK